MKKNMYYDPNKMLSYNRVLNFVIGARGIGKSYGMKKYPINRFLKTGEQFIYLRRYKDELRKIRTNYFSDIMKEFPNHTFLIKGSEIFIDGKIAGYILPLSSWQSLKSNSFPDVSTIIFDEFIREKDNSGYIPNEVSALLNLMDTVFRDRDNVRCICLSNAVSVVNPYFLYFGLVPDIKKRFNAYNTMLIEIPDSVDFSTERRKSRFGMLIDGTEYGGMSLDNEFVNDSSVFIERRSKESKFSFAVVYKGMHLGLWIDVEQGVMFMDTDYDPSSPHIYALSTEDLNENTMMLATWKDNYHLKKMVSGFLQGYLRFDNQVVRTVGYEMFQKMGVQ